MDSHHSFAHCSSPPCSLLVNGCARMSDHDEDVRNRSASSPSLPPTWVLAAGNPNGHAYEEVPSARGQSTPYVAQGEELDALRPKSVPPATGTPTEPPVAPPLPAPGSIKERRKYSRKYGSGLYSELARETNATNSLSASFSSSTTAHLPPDHDSYQSAAQVYTTTAPSGAGDSGTLAF